MAYQIVAVNDGAPGACVDVGLTWNGSDTITSTEAISGTSLTLTSTLTGGENSDVALNTNKFTVDAGTGNVLVAGTLTQTGAAALASTLGVAGVSSFAEACGFGADNNAATSGAVTVPVDTLYDGYTTNDTADIDATLADGEDGQLKIIKLVTKDTNDMVLTPANLGDGTTITFDATGEVAVLVFDGTNWQVVYTNATVDA